MIKPLVKKILEQPFEYEWSLQGLGMLRLYLDDTKRLHIWNNRYRVQNVSQMHTHPWNFKSYVVAGEVRNFRYVEDPVGRVYFKQSIFCGVGGGLEGEATTTRLSMVHPAPEIYTEGDYFAELAHEIHISEPVNGTVTIIEREYLEDSDHAFVFWEDGAWVSAEPRPANKYEIADFTIAALNNWFNGNK